MMVAMKNERIVRGFNRNDTEISITFGAPERE
jgi:hypothetical protein